MTRVSPYYFDNELVSANLQRTDRFENGDEYVFEVDINDDELKGAIGDTLERYEDRIDRWHVDAETDTSIPEDVEGAEPMG